VLATLAAGQFIATLAMFAAERSPEIGFIKEKPE
jgi:hypothetical protein